MARAKRLEIDGCPRWEGFTPGARFACESPYLGREVQLRHGEPLATVVSCTAPPWLAPAARAKLSPRRRCEGGFEVTFPGGLGVPVVVRGSKVRERLRVREGLCPDALVLDPHSGFVAYEEREAHKAGRDPYEGQELPFPHRLGSTPCCQNSSVYPDKVASALRDVISGDGFFEPDDVVAMARKMVPKSMRAGLKISSLEDIPGAIANVRAHCWGVVKTWESKHARTAVYSTAREESAERKLSRIAEDLGVTAATTVGVGGSRRRVEKGWTDRADEKPKKKGRKAALNYFKVG